MPIPEATLILFEGGKRKIHRFLLQKFWNDQFLSSSQWGFFFFWWGVRFVWFWLVVLWGSRLFCLFWFLCLGGLFCFGVFLVYYFVWGGFFVVVVFDEGIFICLGGLGWLA